jgi:hypothetical protein
MEKFKEIEGYNGDYFISNFGNVKSLKYNKVKYLTPTLNQRGYLYVKLSKDNKKTFFLIHKLVAEYFINNPNNKPIPNHKDGDKINNHYLNLEWSTYSENIKHAYDMGLNYVSEENRQKTIQRNKTRVKEVYQMDKQNHNIIKKWDSIIQAANELKIQCCDISKCCRKQGRTKSAGGYYWEFAN